MTQSPIPKTFKQPELIFGLVGPIGVDMTLVSRVLMSALKAVDYTPHPIHITSAAREMINVSGIKVDDCTPSKRKILELNEMRRQSGREDFFALFTISKIAEIRSSQTSKSKDNDDPTPLPGTAYVVRQLKRPEETRALRKTYGDKFVQVSVTVSKDHQLQAVRRLVAQEYVGLAEVERESIVRDLINTDQHEDAEVSGQRLSATFHEGDVFISGNNEKSLRDDCTRFVNAFFGLNSASPTIDEFGSYLAKAASLRSVDMSRQVGSAILSSKGDLIAIGCNEVPRPGGGNYWGTDTSPQRDIDRKIETNKLQTNRIIQNFINTLEGEKLLARSASDILSDPAFLEAAGSAMISDITEFGRMTHAEMTALSDAARLGRSVLDATIYVTTFPCHNCAKHLIAAGLSRIVYIEPYPKSLATTLHDDALTYGGCEKRVLLDHFRGISPRRFRDIFEKGKRRDKDGKINEWYEGAPRPLIADRGVAYILNESSQLQILEEAIRKIDKKQT